MSIYNMYPHDVDDVSIQLPAERMNFEEFMQVIDFSETELLMALFSDPKAPEIQVLSFPTFFRKDVEKYVRYLKKMRGCNGG